MIRLRKYQNIAESSSQRTPGLNCPKDLEDMKIMKILRLWKRSKCNNEKLKKIRIKKPQKVEDLVDTKIRKGQNEVKAKRKSKLEGFKDSKEVKIKYKIRFGQNEVEA